MEQEQEKGNVRGLIIACLIAFLTVIATIDVVSREQQRQTVKELTALVAFNDSIIESYRDKIQLLTGEEYANLNDYIASKITRDSVVEQRWLEVEIRAEEERGGI